MNTFKPTENNFRKKNKLEDKYIILGVANIWTNRKGLGCFINLAKQLKEDEVIVLVGLSDKQLKELPKNIIGIARTNSVEELADIYSSADVFVNPTLEDNFPTTNLEALACGTPVITFDTGGSPESIDKQTGIVIDLKSREKLYGSICDLKSKKKKIDIETIIDRAIRKYNKVDNFNSYISLYKKINNKK